MERGRDDKVRGQKVEVSYCTASQISKAGLEAQPKQ
jgi:hypothetical protein